MSTIKKLRLLRLASYGVVLLMIVFAFNYKSFLRSFSATSEDAGWCGVVDNDINDEKLTEGGKLFRSLCASCHKLDRNFIGPALGDITERRDKDYLYAYIVNEDSIRKFNPEIPNDSVVKMNHRFPQLSKDHIKQILDYTH